MASSSYDGALRRLLLHEGGYSNHPSDPGGPTKFGITIHDYRRYLKADGTAADIKAMPLDAAKRIYRLKYWDAQRCDALPAGVDYAVFDYGVNSGTGRSGKVLRRVLRLPDSSSVVNDTVIAAARAADATALVGAICDERLRFLQSLRTWPVFGKGWGRRVADVRAVALALAGGGRLPAPREKTTPGRAAVPLATGVQQGSAGAVAAAGAATAQQAHAAGANVTTIVVIAGAAIVLTVAAWLFWRARQRRQQERPV